MKLIFWVSVALISYTYAGYLAWLWLRHHWRNWPVKRAPYSPRVSVVMVVRNEAKNLERKLQNLQSLHYPAELVQIIIISDGSSDGTEAILRRFAENPRVLVFLNQQPRGKASCLNDGIATAEGEIVVFTDARQTIEPDAVRLLLEAFADPDVGCVSGELMLGDPSSGEALAGMGLYWKIEKKVRELESSSGSVIGATGAFYALRRTLAVPIPPETILDDVYVPMHVLRQKRRVVFDARARAWDIPHQGRQREFARKVRTLSGNYQLLKLVPWLLSNENPSRFEFISHKILRLTAPFALIAAFVSSVFLHRPFYRSALTVQTVFYFLSVLGALQFRPRMLARVIDAAFTFTALNAAAVVAFGNFILRRPISWDPQSK